VSKLNLFVSLGLISLLSGCGDGKKDEPVVATYGYSGNGFSNQCSPKVAQDWNKLIASRCNNVQGPQMARACTNGAERFRYRYPRISCNIAVADTSWGPGNWRQQAFFEINDFVINSIFQQHGWVSTGPNRPLQPGQDGDQHGFPGQR